MGQGTLRIWKQTRPENRFSCSTQRFHIDGHGLQFEYSEYFIASSAEIFPGKESRAWKYKLQEHANFSDFDLSFFVWEHIEPQWVRRNLRNLNLFPYTMMMITENLHNLSYPPLWTSWHVCDSGLSLVPSRVARILIIRQTSNVQIISC